MLSKPSISKLRNWNFSKLIFIVIFVTAFVFAGCSKKSISDQTGTSDSTNSQTYEPELIGLLSGHTVYEQIALQPDGKIIVYRYGNYNDTLLRLLPTGDVDPQFVISSFPNGVTSSFPGGDNVYEILVQNDGKILLLGDISISGSTSIIRLNPNGQIDNTFTPLIGNGKINCMVLQPDGKILVGGSFGYTQNGTQGYKLLRLNTDGTLDNSFTSPFSSGGSNSSNRYIGRLATDSKGRIIAVGFIGILNDAVSERNVVRLNVDGSVDQSFDSRDGFSFPGVVAPIFRSIAVDALDRILVGGKFNPAINSSGVPTGPRDFVRFRTDGTIDTQFAVDAGEGDVTAILPQSNGDIVVGRNYGLQTLGFATECVNIYNSKGKSLGFKLGFYQGFVTDLIQETPKKILVAGGLINNNPVSTEVGLCRIIAK